MNARNMLYSLAVLVAAGIISACLDEAESHSGVSAAQLQALVDRVAVLEANQPGDKVFAGDGTGGAFLAKAATADGKALGTMVGFLPVDQPSYKSTKFGLKSPNGYLYAVPNDNLGTSGFVAISGLEPQGSVTVPLYYASADCTGQPHVPSALISDYGASQGVVFRIGAGEFNQISDDPAQYLYVPAGTVRVENFGYQSKTNTTFSCTAEVGEIFIAFPALLNDPVVTGVDSAPVPLPIALVDESA